MGHMWSAPFAASSRAGLSCRRSPLRNQMTEVLPMLPSPLALAVEARRDAAPLLWWGAAAAAAALQLVWNDPQYVMCAPGPRATQSTSCLPLNMQFQVGLVHWLSYTLRYQRETTTLGNTTQMRFRLAGA